MDIRDARPLRWISPVLLGAWLLSGCSGDGPVSPDGLQAPVEAPVVHPLGEMPPPSGDAGAATSVAGGGKVTAEAPTSQGISFDPAYGVFTFTQVVDGSSSPPHYLRPSSGGFGQYSAYYQSFGWAHDFPLWNDPTVTILSAQVQIRAYDVDSNVANGEFDRISVDGVALDPGWLQGSNAVWSITTFDIPVGTITDDGWMNMYNAIDVYRRGWLTTLDWSRVTITYRTGPVNHPPYTPTGDRVPAGAPSAGGDLSVNVTGPTPADPDGHTVTHEYRWFLYQNGAYQDPPGGIYRQPTVPASMTGAGQLWRVYVTAKDELGAISNPLILDFPAITANAAPVAAISFNCPGPYREGLPQVCPSGGGTVDPDDDVSTLTFAWSYGDGTTHTQLGVAGTPGHVYAQDGTYTITLTVTDPDGASHTVTAVVEVENVLPQIGALADQATLEGTAFTTAGSFVDPGADSWTATVDYGDGAGPQSLALAGSDFSLGHTYADDGDYTVTVSVADDDGVGSRSFRVTVGNVAPSIGQMSDASVTEGGAYSGSGSFGDPGADSWTATVDYGDGSGPQTLAVNGTSFSLGHTYADDVGSPFTVEVSVTDDDGGTDVMTLQVAVANAAPVVAGFSGATLESGDTFGFSTTFSDVGLDDAPWQVDIDWGDGAENSSASSQSDPVGGSHRYFVPGLYTVVLTVTDKDGGSSSAQAVVEVTRKAVGIDVKPGSAENPININDKGVAPVAVLSDADFDATRIDRTTLALGPGGATPTHSALGHLEDVDADGDLDLLGHFTTGLIGLADGDTGVCMTGVTEDGVWFQGCDTVRAFANEPKGKGSGKGD